MHAVNEALRSHAGVQLESLRMGRAAVRYDEQVTTPDAIEAAIAEGRIQRLRSHGERIRVTTAKIIVTVLGLAAIGGQLRQRGVEQLRLRRFKHSYVS